jgi:nickel/cobalt transporter (NicO) family protein
MKIVVLTIALFILLTPRSISAQNPFFGNQQETTSPGAGTSAIDVSSTTERSLPVTDKTARYPSFIKSLFEIAGQWQKFLRGRLVVLGKDIRENPFGISFWSFLLFSFIYGVIHAIGPGHGKTIVCSYFLNRPGSLYQGLLMGNLITAIHVFSATMVIMLLYLIFEQTGMAGFEDFNPKLQKISYSLLIAIGIYLAGKSIYLIKKGDMANPEECSAADLKSLIVTSIATGLIPCPGAAIILSFTVILGITETGLLAMVFIAIGMGLTTSTIALLTIYFRKTAIKTATGNRKAFLMIHSGLSLGGATAIIALGLLLLFGVQ